MTRDLMWPPAVGGAYARQHFSVPNNIVGKLVVWTIRRYLNRKTYRLVLRGRGVDLKKALPVYEAFRARRVASEITYRAAHPEYQGAPIPSLSIPPTPAQMRYHWRQSVPPRLAQRIGIYIEIRDRARMTRPAGRQA